jgi:hypothetical protein
MMSLPVTNGWAEMVGSDEELGSALSESSDEGEELVGPFRRLRS